jgi:Txe/YoeB family toxin of Txe-Axe toxin-antitoxin module
MFEIIENLMDKQKTCLNKICRMNSRTIRTPQTKHLIHLNELREDFYKHKSETKETINKEICKVKKTRQNMEKELNKDMENLRKNNQSEVLKIKTPFNQIKNRVEGHCSRRAKVEERLSGLKDKTDIKEKIGKLVVKNHKSCERKM